MSSRAKSVPRTRDGRGVLVSIKIFDVLGNEIETIVNQQLQPGTYVADWNASNYPSGIYFYQLIVNSEQLTVFKETKKMMLVK